METVFLSVSRSLASLASLLVFVVAARAADGPFALQFDGVNDYVAMRHFTPFNSDRLTVTAWIKTTQTAGEVGLVNKYVASSFNGWNVFLFNGELRAWYFRDSANFIWDGGRGLNAGFVADGQWHHIAFVVNPTEGRLYVDGLPWDARFWDGSAGSATTEQELRLGSYPGSGFYNGTLDEVTVWSRALSGAEISGMRSNSLAGVEAGLNGYYRLTEGTGTTAANNGTAGFLFDGLVNGPVWVAGVVLKPGVVTFPAGAVSTNSALLSASASPGGTNARGWFEWGTTTNYGNVTAPQSLGAGGRATNLSQSLAGLTFGTRFHFRAVASNTLGIAVGTNQTFRTLGLAVDTLPASALAERTATLNGQVIPSGSAARAWFEWGTTTNYGIVTPQRAIGSGNTPTNISEILTNLTPNVSHHFRAVASNSFGLVFGANQTFIAPAQTTVHFDDFSDGTRITEQYASLGIHFLNDFRSGQLFTASPAIAANARAASPGNVLVNGYADCELANSGGTPLVFWFDRRMATVRMSLGTIPSIPGACFCENTLSASVRFWDCTGGLLGQVTTNITTNFNAQVQFADPQQRIQRVDVDYGNSFCPEAIDSLAFTRGTGTCLDTTAPFITITSHTNDQLVIDSLQQITGYVMESGILKSLLLDGVVVPYVLRSDGRYHFTTTMTLAEGNNTLTFVGENASGLKGSVQLRLFLGTPVSAVLNSFHLTQRGVMQDEVCDVDVPFVAGKTAVVRVNMDVRTAAGMATYASSIKMNVWRKPATGSDVLVGSFFGNTYSPFNSTLNSPSDLAAVHFWIPGSSLAFDTAGLYRFTFEAYVGFSLIGVPLRPCQARYFAFEETKPVRLLILPVERGRNDPLWSGTPHYGNFYQQLDTVARAYPVRDGFGIPSSSSGRGLIFYETSPLYLCDGSEAYTSLEHCDGTGWTWDFIDNDPSGMARRANDLTVKDPLISELCDANNPIIGGMIPDNLTETFNFNPALGLYRTAHVRDWPEGKHVTPQDEDRDGDIDAADLAFYAAEFFDTSTARWTTDFSRYNQGEPFRNFRDENGNFCKDSDEPLAPVMQRALNQKGMIWDPARKALNEMNSYIPGTDSDFRSASLWFPDPLIPKKEFGASGPGQGERPGKLSWIRVMDIVAMAHELGHNFDLPDLYLDNIPDDLKSIEDAWAVYIDGRSKPPNKVFEIMAVSQAPDTELFSRAHYQKLFDQLKVPSSFAAASEGGSPGADTNQFVFSGIIYDDDGHVDKVATRLASGLEPTPAAPASPYSLVFGQGTVPLSTFRFDLDPRPEPHGPGQIDDINYRWFHVVTAFPANAQWVEMRHDDHVLTRVDRTAAVPAPRVLFPNGGQAFGAAQAVNIQWSANDADSSALRSSVFYSADGGANWLLLAAALRGTNHLWNTATWPGSTNGLIRVVVCDGFNSAEDRSDSRFAVAGKPPRVAILNPKPGQTILQCARPLVRGVAEDMEDRINAVVWSVDGLRATARLEAELLPLSPGPHVLRFEAFDSSGQSGFAEITVNVLADTDCDGMSDDFENAHGLNAGSVNDARADLDEDRLSNFDEAVYGTNPTVSDTDGDLYPDGMEVGAASDALDPLNTPFTSGAFTNALYVNSGGPGVRDSLGRPWRRDAPFLLTGNSFTVSFTGVIDTSLLSDPTVPQTVLLAERTRDGRIGYGIPVRNGFYSVILYFSENCLACVNFNLGGDGPAGSARLFDLAVEDRRLNAYNPADAAIPPANNGIGETFKATQVVFTDVPVTDGLLNIDILDRGAGNPPENAAIKGLAVLQQAGAGTFFPPHIASVERVEGTLLRIMADPDANRAAYQAGLTRLELEQSTDLRTWTNVGPPVGRQGNLVVFETSLNGPARFYRIAARAGLQPVIP